MPLGLDLLQGSGPHPLSGSAEGATGTSPGKCDIRARRDLNGDYAPSVTRPAAPEKGGEAGSPALSQWRAEARVGWDVYPDSVHKPPRLVGVRTPTATSGLELSPQGAHRIECRDGVCAEPRWKVSP